MGLGSVSRVTYCVFLTCLSWYCICYFHLTIKWLAQMPSIMVWYGCSENTQCMMGSSEDTGTWWPITKLSVRMRSCGDTEAISQEGIQMAPRFSSLESVL